jgi:hypothetical protein
MILSPLKSELRRTSRITPCRMAVHPAHNQTTFHSCQNSYIDVNKPRRISGCVISSSCVCSLLRPMLISKTKTLSRHHWTIGAYEDLSQQDDIIHMWRIAAPQHAVAHTFFMHEILAFSALHRAHLSPEQRTQYYGYGIHHQDLAIRGVREKLRDVRPQEAPSIVATSTLLTLSVFASTGFELNYPEIPSSQTAIDGILNIFNLMQGMGNVLALAQVHVVNDSFLAPMFRDPVDPVPSQPMLEEASQRLPALTSFVESKSDLSELERSIYLVAIANLLPPLQMAQSPCMDNRELRFLFLWPMTLHPDFLSLVRQRSAGALAVVMYYSTILFASQSRYWFMERWGEQLMRACFEKLDPGWHSIVQWPMSFLNTVPGWNLFQSMVHARYGPGLPQTTPSSQAFVYGNRKPADVSQRQKAASSPSPYERTN